MEHHIDWHRPIGSGDDVIASRIVNSYLPPGVVIRRPRLNPQMEPEKWKKSQPGHQFVDLIARSIRPSNHGLRDDRSQTAVFQKNALQLHLIREHLIRQLPPADVVQRRCFDNLGHSMVARGGNPPE